MLKIPRQPKQKLNVCQLGDFSQYLIVGAQMSTNGESLYQCFIELSLDFTTLVSLSTEFVELDVSQSPPSESF